MIERLGEGGMGSVYLAEDPDLDRKVALKLLGNADADQASLRRTLREAKTMAMLQHPNVATVFDVGTHGGFVFITMEYVDGWTAHDWVRRQRPGWQAILDAFVQAGRGLVAAHDAGLIHRDFKPSNVLVGRDGRTRVGDFGLARRDRRTAPATVPPPMDEATPTFDSAVVGTPAYMAPEQHLGQPIDARSDQFSFCVSLWEALYRQRPFDAATPFGVLTQIVEGKLRPPPTGSEVVARVQHLLERGLSADPDKRFASLVPLLDALETCAADREAPDVPSSVAPPPTAAQLPERYRIEGPLAEGAIERLYRAIDTTSGEVVAVRPLQISAAREVSGKQPASRGSLEASFRGLLSMRHPNIAAVVDAGLDARREPYLVLALGDDARPFLEAAGGMRLTRQVELLGQLLLALDALHRRGVVHDGVGPQSVVVTKRGLQLLWCDSALHGFERPSGAWGYVAPEVLVGKPASPVSDLYAVGALAFSLWAGRSLLSAKSWEEATDAVLAQQPALEELQVSSELRSWVAGMLHKRAEGRLVSALDAIALLREASGCPLEESTPETRDAGLRAAPLVGRDDALAQLRRELELGIDQRKPRRVWLAGPSGAGKSRLLSELGAMARARGANVVASPELDEPAPPFQLWRPALEASHIVMPSGDAAPRVEQLRMADALEESFERATHATVVLLDDVDRAGEESQALLEELARRPQPALLAITTERSDVALDVDPHLYIHLHGVDREAVIAWAATALGRGKLSPSSAERIVEDGALPLTVLERLRDVGGESPTEALSVQEAVAARFEQLPDEVAELTATAAAAGPRVDVPLMLRAHPGADLDAWLGALTRAALSERHGHTYRFNHEQTRRAIVAALSDEELQAAHRRIAEALADVADVDPERLAHHAHLAGMHEEQLEQLAAATERALALDERRAERLCRRALDLAGDAAPLTKAGLWHRLALALLGQQRAEEALAAARQALGQLGRELPTSTLGRWWSVVRGMARLLLKPPAAALPAPRSGRGVHSQLAASLDLVCRALIASGRPLDLVSTSVWALDADQRAGRSGALPLAVLAFAMGRLSARLALKTFGVARARAHAAEPTSEATVLLVEACYQAGRGELDRAAGRAQDAIELAHTHRAADDEARAMGVMAQLARCRGAIDEQRQTATRLVEQSRPGEPGRIAAIACLCAALHAQGRDATARDHLAEVAAATAPSLDAAAWLAEHAVNAARARQWTDAIERAQRARRASTGLGVLLWLGQPLSSIAEALLDAWQQGGHEQARLACLDHARTWRRLARRQPLLRAPWHLFAGRFAHTHSSPSEARRHFDAALRDAQTLGLALCEGEAHLELALMLDDEDLRAEHHDRALELLSRCGATHALSRLESADR